MGGIYIWACSSDKYIDTLTLLLAEILFSTSKYITMAMVSILEQSKT